MDGLYHSTGRKLEVTRSEEARGVKLETERSTLLTAEMLGVVLGWRASSVLTVFEEENRQNNSLDVQDYVRLSVVFTPSSCSSNRREGTLPLHFLEAK